MSKNLRKIGLLSLGLSFQLAFSQEKPNQDPVTIEHPPILEFWGQVGPENGEQASFLTPEEIQEVKDWSRDSVRDLENLKKELDRFPLDRQRNEFLSRVNKIVKNSGGLRVETLMRLSLSRALDLDKVLVAYSDGFSEDGFSLAHLQFLKDMLDLALTVANRESHFFSAQKLGSAGAEGRTDFAYKPSRALFGLEVAKLVRGYAGRVFVLDAVAQFEVMLLATAHLELDLHRDKDKMKFAYEINSLNEVLSEVPRRRPLPDRESIWHTQTLFARLNEVVEALENREEFSIKTGQLRFIRNPREGLEKVRLIQGLSLLRQTEGDLGVLNKLIQIYERKDFEKFGDDWFLASLYFCLQPNTRRSDYGSYSRLTELMLSPQKGKPVFPAELAPFFVQKVVAYWDTESESEKLVLQVRKNLISLFFEGFPKKAVVLNSSALNRLREQVLREFALNSMLNFYVEQFLLGQNFDLKQFGIFLKGSIDQPWDSTFISRAVNRRKSINENTTVPSAENVFLSSLETYLKQQGFWRI